MKKVRQRDASSSTGSPETTELAATEPSLNEMRKAAAKCRACDLWENATQTVFGEGSPNARIMLVGEQPGDKEDLSGHPFVGPAGKLLNEALLEAGIDRADVYFTNIVKHFKWSPGSRSKRRIHEKPRSSEINACVPWLQGEIRLAKPEVLVCLGATAAQALLGKSFSVTRRRGQLFPSRLAPYVLATVHPSSILRAPDVQARHSQMREFVKDLHRVATLLVHQKKTA
jgi:uracil-DNA glycosylase family protein